MPHHPDPQPESVTTGLDITCGREDGVADDNSFPWYARVLGWILQRIFGNSER